MSDDGEVVDLSADERRTIDAIYERRLTATHYEILGVARDADRKAIRDAYFALSKRFHPDVFFKRSLGGYRVRIDELFRVFTRAYDVLGNAKHRSGYDLHIASLETASRPPPPVQEVTGIVDAARRAASQVPSTPMRHGPSSGTMPAVSAVAPRPPPQPVVNLPPPTRTVPRPVMPPIGTAVMPPAPPVPAAPPHISAKPTPSPMQALDPETLRRARESMARRLNSVVPGRSPSGTVRAATPTPAPMPAVAPSQGQVPRTVERAAPLSHYLAAAEEAQKKGDFAAAAEALKQALAMSKDDEALKVRYESMRKLMLTQQVDAHINQAREAMRDGHALEAAKHWELAAEGRPNDPLLLLNAAEVLAKYTREYKRATDIAQRVAMVDPGNVKAHVVLAGVFIKAGLKASAYASIQTIAKLSPDLPALKELREKLGPYTLAEKVGLRGR